MRILYLGEDSNDSTSLHRAHALRRLGHQVEHINPAATIPRNRWVNSFNVRTGFRLFATACGRRVLRDVADRPFDVCWIDQGAELPPSLYRRFRERGLPIVNYNVDDPFGNRDRRKWDLYLQAVKYHDLTVVVRHENIAEAGARGARRVMRVFRSFDPVAHAPEQVSPAEVEHWRSRVLFLGTWMPERGPFLAGLVRRGLPLTIQGGGWQRAREPEIAQCWRGGAVYNRDYVAAQLGAEISLGLLSKGNRDLHTQRSAEVPYIGTAFACERTDDHEAMFAGGDSAVMWRNEDDCFEACMRLLTDPERRRRVAGRGRSRVLELGLSNDQVMQTVLHRLADPDASHK